MSFQQALQFTLVAEGGYSNVPGDHGGPTNCGITQATYDRYRDLVQQPRQAVSLITDAEVRACYYQLYWFPSHADQLETRLGVCMFDWAVNHGPTGAIETLQQTLGIPDDGLFGRQTLQAVTAAGGSVWRAFNNERRQWYKDDVIRNPSQQKFLDGWLARVDRLDTYVEAL